MFAAYMTKDMANIHIVLEHMDMGSLADVFRKSDIRIPEPILAFLVLQVTEALRTLHLNDIVHRDVKLENILLNSDAEVKLTDFGIEYDFVSLDAKYTLVLAEVSASGPTRQCQALEQWVSLILRGTREVVARGNKGGRLFRGGVEFFVSLLH